VSFEPITKNWGGGIHVSNTLELVFWKIWIESDVIRHHISTSQNYTINQLAHNYHSSYYISYWIICVIAFDII